jgi:protein ImuB
MLARSPQLFACVHAPDFSVQAAWRSTPSLASDEVPRAVLDGPDSLLKVFACNGQARTAGIAIGMTKIQAEACPGIMLSKRVREDEELAQQALVDCGFNFSSRVESTGPGTIIIDLTGAERLLGSPQEIGRKIIEECGASFTVNAAMAPNPDTALYGARGFSGLTIIAPGEEAFRLAPLPVPVLEVSPEVLDTLESWGIRNFQALAILPPIPLSERLGQYGLHLQRLARGEIKRELVPAERPLCFEDSFEMEEPIELLEPLGFVLNRLLEQISQRLAARSLATDEIRLDLDLEVHADRQLQADSVTAGDPPFHHTRLKLPVPTQDAKLLFKLLQLDLAARPPAAAVKKITVEALPARVRTTQTGLFQPLAPEPARLEITLARLRAVVGEKDDRGRGRVGFPAVSDSYRPDSFEVMPSFSPLKQLSTVPLRKSSTALTLRLFRPPLPASVELTGAVPSRITFNGIRSEVKQASGPWEGSGEWWSKSQEWRRQEWDIGLAGIGSPGVYRVFQDCISGKWFVEGMYD